MFAKNRDQSGFTIVEVMIVLAIAGLILAIVFIAVPALQRNSRNTGRRADLGNLRAQVETWVSNNGGKIPNHGSGDDLAAIVESTGWGHYNGNDINPDIVVKLGAVITGQCIPATAGTIRNQCIDPAGGSPADLGIWNAQTTSGDTEEYQVGYIQDDDPAAFGLEYPDRQEIHIFGEAECGTADGVLAGGNDTDGGGGASYASGDVVLSNARAIAYVYQIEGEDNARCEDNT